MALPHSMDYLNAGGVLDFDAAAYLNGQPAGSNYGPQLLGNVRMQSQPQNDSFSSKAKAKLKDVNFLKKAAAAVCVSALAFVGLGKCKQGVNAVQNSKFGQWVANIFKKAPTA